VDTLDEGDVRARRRRLVLLVVLVVVVLWALVLAAKTLSAYHDASAGIDQLQSVKSHLSPGEATAAGTEATLRSAEAHFAAASGSLDSPIFLPVEVVPVVGRQFRSVKALSGAARTVAGTGADFLHQVNGLVDAPHGAGPERVASLRALAADSAAAARTLDGVETGPSAGLVAPLARREAQFVSDLDQARDRLRNAAAVAAVTATILQGPQAYLVMASNNAEMRFGSGAFLQVGVATTQDGALTLGDLQPSGNLGLAPGQVTPTGQLARNWGFLDPGIDWRTLGLSPQFDVTAPLAASMWTAKTGQTVDGALALDVPGLAALMRASGPVTVHGTTVTAGTVEEYLLHDQYEGLTDDNTADNGRQDALGQLASAVLNQLQANSSDLRTLGDAVASAVAGRNLMVWSRAPAAQAAWVAAGVSGSLSADSLDVGVINQGGNKLDPYLPVRVALATATTGGATRVTLATTLTNTTPGGQSQYIAGPYPGLPLGYGDYAGLVAVNLPGAARSIAVQGAGPLAVKGGDGPTWVVAAPVTVRRGSALTVTVTFTLPGTSGSMRLVPSARVPAEQWSFQGATFDDQRPRTLRW
jgi:hypothetical protein